MVSAVQEPALSEGCLPPPISHDSPFRGQTRVLREALGWSQAPRPGERLGHWAAREQSALKERWHRGPCGAPEAEEREATGTLLPALC